MKGRRRVQGAGGRLERREGRDVKEKGGGKTRGQARQTLSGSYEINRSLICPNL